jgi:hypothetical protein
VYPPPLIVTRYTPGCGTDAVAALTAERRLHVLDVVS